MERLQTSAKPEMVQNSITNNNDIKRDSENKIPYLIQEFVIFDENKPGKLFFSDILY
jgi:hypothetical protein